MAKFKDERITEVSIESFFSSTNCLDDCTDNLWCDETKPDPYSYYYKFTADKLIYVSFDEKVTNFGTNIEARLHKIFFCKRDGRTEYDLIKNKISELNNGLKFKKFSKNKFKQIYESNKIIDLLPKYQVASKKQLIFEDHIVNTGYKTENDKLKGKYVVIDVETNGISTNKDDLLSISIYDPSTGCCYNRFLPLHLQPMVLTTYLNGIKTEDLIHEADLTQEEVDKIAEYFNLNNRIILSYSGGKGEFDKKFLINYCKRLGINGFENYNYENIKQKLPIGKFDTASIVTKDNMCRIFKIEGISSVHTSINDCLLEWKLFEKIYDQTLFFRENKLYRYHPNYIIPISYYNENPEIFRSAGIEIPFKTAKLNPIFEYQFPRRLIKKVKKFSTNINGIAIENRIKNSLNAIECNNIEFLSENAKKLELIAKFDRQITPISVLDSNDGSLIALNKCDEVKIKEINKATKAIIDGIAPVINFIKTKIFGVENVYSQELVISDDEKILALCDLSSKDAVLEIKTFKLDVNRDGYLSPKITRQIQYEKKNRKPYIIEIYFDTSFDQVVKGLNINIYEAIFEDEDRFYKLNHYDFSNLTFIKENQDMSIMQVYKSVSKRNVDKLILLGYLKKERCGRNFCLKLLRSLDDEKTIVNEETYIQLNKYLDF